MIDRFQVFQCSVLIFTFWCDVGKVLAEGEFTGRTVPGLETQINSSSLVKDIHGAPLDSFVVKLSEAISCLKTLQKMASYWSRVVSEVSREMQLYLNPHVPDDLWILGLVCQI